MTFPPEFRIALSLGVAQFLFLNGLRASITRITPELNPESIINASATSLAGSGLERYASQIAEEDTQTPKVTYLSLVMLVLVVVTWCFMEIGCKETFYALNEEENTMGKFYETIPPTLYTWILTQKIFWVATAPLSGTGHVNVSPKGGPYFGLLDNRTFWYLDMTGSGSETISHIYEPGNGRVTIMFNAFEGPPRIVRLWGKGRVLENGGKEFADFVERNHVQLVTGTRSIIVVDVHQAGSSCGFSVPFYEFKEFRETLLEYNGRKEKKYKEGNEGESFPRYWASNNTWSMDNLPGMKTALVVSSEEKIVPTTKMVGPLAPKNLGIPSRGLLLNQRPAASLQPSLLLLVALLSFIMGVCATLFVGSENVMDRFATYL
ncbi:hypothetical protein TMatcc_004108 [Talaromyces marneffei ATCC 18224]